MTTMTLITCSVVLVSVAGAIAVLPWSDLALAESAQAWTGLWHRILGRPVTSASVAPAASRAMEFTALSLDASVLPPRPATVWSPPSATPERRCA